MANKKSVKVQQRISDDSKDYSSFKIVLFYCSLIIFFPILVFFVTKSIVFEQLLNVESMRSNIYGAVGAVIALHLALGLYIYRAYFGSSTSSSTKED